MRLVPSSSSSVLIQNEHMIIDSMYQMRRLWLEQVQSLNFSKLELNL